MAIWLKNEAGKNIPFNEADFDDKLIINVIDNQNKGQFIFTKEVLRDKGIITSNYRHGKMAFRLYPIWSEDLNDSASTMQLWQLPYFVDLTKDSETMKIDELYFS